MRTRVLYAVIFSAFFLLVALIQWPAAWLHGRIEQVTGGRWKVSGAEGTLWNGSATVLLAASSASDEYKAGNGRWRVVQNVRWKLAWNELWRGRLGLETTLERGRVLVTLGALDFALEQADLQLPAAVLGGLIEGPSGRYGWTGLLHVRSPAFRCSWHRQDCTGDIELLWQDAAVTELPGPVLGSYRVRIVGEGASAHFDLSTQEGRLQIAGRGTVGGGGLRFAGEASVTGDDSGPLEARVRSLGRPSGTPGKYAINYRESGPSR